MQYAKTTLKQKLYLVRTIVNAPPLQSRGDAYQAKTSYIQYSPSSRVVMYIYIYMFKSTHACQDKCIYIQTGS